MAYSTAIITFVTSDSKPEYIFRMLKNVDEQSTTDYHHFLVCESDDVMKRVRSFFSLLSTGYADRSSLLVYDDFTPSMKTVENDSAYVAIHPVEDMWSPLFLEKMIMELTSCTVDVGGVWCRYNIANEVVRGKVISTDKTTSGPDYAGLIRPTYSSFRSATYVQGLYFVEDVFEQIASLTPIMHETVFTASIGLKIDILGITETLATVHNRRVTPIDIREQQARNWLYRNHPMLMVGINA